MPRIAPAPSNQFNYRTSGAVIFEKMVAEWMYQTSEPLAAEQKPTKRGKPSGLPLNVYSTISP
jgi:hypothetical protein